MTITLPCLESSSKSSTTLEITATQSDGDNPELTAMDASIISCSCCAGVDVASPAYVEGIETAVELEQIGMKNEIVAFRRRRVGNELVKQETTPCQSKAKSESKSQPRSLPLLNKTFCPGEGCGSSGTRQTHTMLDSEKPYRGVNIALAWHPAAAAWLFNPSLGNIPPMETDGLLCQSSP